MAENSYKGKYFQQMFLLFISSEWEKEAESTQPQWVQWETPADCLNLP